MAIQPIKQDICIGCGRCVNACPVDVIRVTEHKAHVRYPEECMCCASCEDVCPTHAIYVSPEKRSSAYGLWR